MLRDSGRTFGLPTAAVLGAVVVGAGIAFGAAVTVLGIDLSLLAFAGIVALLLLLLIRLDRLAYIWILTLPFDYHTLTIGPVGISAGDAILLVWACRLVFQGLAARNARLQFSPQFIPLLPFVLAELAHAALATDEFL